MNAIDRETQPFSTATAGFFAPPGIPERWSLFRNVLPVRKREPYHLYGMIANNPTIQHMAVLSIETLFDAAIRIQLQERAIAITFAGDGVHIKFPTTRRLAEYLEVPHYYVLPYFATMEQEELVTRAERVGILTTVKGSRMMIGIMKTRYRAETEPILGPVIFRELMKSCT